MSARLAGVVRSVLVVSCLVAACGADDDEGPKPDHGGRAGTGGGAAGKAARAGGAGRQAVAGEAGEAGSDVGGKGSGATGGTRGSHGGSERGGSAGRQAVAGEAGSDVGGTFAGAGGNHGGEGTDAGDGGTLAGDGGGGVAGAHAGDGGGGTASGSGGTAGWAGSATAGTGNGGSSGSDNGPCEDGSTRECCRNGTQTCTLGEWGGCEGAFISAESCNGIDDDCDGEVDELGTTTCGVGACTTTVSACDANGVSACIPPAPSTNSDGCDGIDNDCDGAVDEDCAQCLHVAPDGDDGAATANPTTTFQTVQAAIDFADAHRDGPTRVCVAAGAACGATGTHLGPANADLTMRDGIDVLGGYESSSWTRCNDSPTHLAPQSGNGVVFQESITHRTVLDGFVIDRFAATTTVAVLVNGAQNVVLSNLVLPVAPSASYAYGIVLENEAKALVFRSRIEGGTASTEDMAVRATDSELRLEDNCPTTPSNRCSTACSSTGPGIAYAAKQPAFIAPALSVALSLENSPRSRIERSAICANGGFSGYSSVYAVDIRGDATDVRIRGSTVDVHPTSASIGTGEFVAVHSSDCAGGSPWLADNHWLGVSGATLGHAVELAGDCSPVIEQNAAIGSSGDRPRDALAIQCGKGCVISRNADVSNDILAYPDSVPAYYAGRGIACTDCRVDRNVIAGVGYTPYSGSSANTVSGIGATVTGSSLVDGNDIAGLGGVGFCHIGGIGLSISGGTVTNNVIFGSKHLPDQLATCLGSAPPAVMGASVGNTLVSSNRIVALPSGQGCYLNAVWYGLVTFGGGTFRNNAFEGCVSVRESSTTADPAIFENNSLERYLDEGAEFPGVLLPGQVPATTYIGVNEVNALTDMTSSGNIGACTFSSSHHLSAGSPCIDAGTPLSAPRHDFEGDSRDALPDIGPDEYVPAPRDPTQPDAFVGRSDFGKIRQDVAPM